MNARAMNSNSNSSIEVDIYTLESPTNQSCTSEKGLSTQTTSESASTNSSRMMSDYEEGEMSYESYEKQLQVIGFIPIQNNRDFDSDANESETSAEIEDMLDNLSPLLTVRYNGGNGFDNDFYAKCSNSQDVDFRGKSSVGNNNYHQMGKASSQNLMALGQNGHTLTGLDSVNKVLFTIESSEMAKNNFLSAKIHKLNLPLIQQGASDIERKSDGDQLHKIKLENVIRFCSGKLKMLEKRNDKEKIAKEGRRQKTVVCSSLIKEKEVSIPRPWLERMRWINLIHDLEKMKTEPIHSPKTCTDCRLIYDMEEGQRILKFLVQRIERPLVEQKIEHHLLKNNPVSLLGELARCLPRIQCFKTHV